MKKISGEKKQSHYEIEIAKDNQVLIEKNENDQNQSNSFDDCFRLKFSICSKLGNSLETIKGKDTYVIIQKPVENFYFMGVFDSHGSSGKEVSETLSNFYQNLIESNYKSFLSYQPGKEEPIAKFLKDSIQKAENYLKINNIDLKYSGSTVHLMIIIRKMIFILNLGNSRSVLYRELDGEKFAIELSDDHVPSNKTERYRIYENGGIVERIILDN